MLQGIVLINLFINQQVTVGAERFTALLGVNSRVEFRFYILLITYLFHFKMVCSVPTSSVGQITMAKMKTNKQMGHIADILLLLRTTQVYNG